MGKPDPKDADLEFAAEINRRLHPEWPKRIPRDRAVHALELAGMILDQEASLDPAVGEGDNFETVTLDAGTWDRFVKRAGFAVGGLKRVEVRPLPEKPEPPDYADALEAFEKSLGGARAQLTAEVAAFEAGWNAGRKRTKEERERDSTPLVTHPAFDARGKQVGWILEGETQPRVLDMARELRKTKSLEDAVRLLSRWLELPRSSRP